MADFATVAELETWMGVSNLGSRGTAMLGYASATIRAYAQQDIESTAGRQESYAGDAWATYIQLTQRPVTAVSAITIDGVAFADFTWTRWGQINKDDWSAWDTGPILITYDSGYGPTSDEYLSVKAICLDVAKRALAGATETYGLEVPEYRGSATMYLTAEEKTLLDFLGVVAVA